VNPGGEPERDDTGLPPVDIEIPDDARELDRDVQAYHRELRAERRRQRRGRMQGRLARNGVMLPLLACCLILALITGTLLTVFTATSDQNLVTSPVSPNTSHARTGNSASASATAAPSASSSAAAGAATGSRIRTTSLQRPDARLIVDGQKTLLQNMTRTMLVLIPPDCRCTAAVTGLTGIAGSENARTVLVGSTRRTYAEAKRLRSQLAPGTQTTVNAALDRQAVLQTVVRADGLTVVLISADTTRSGAQSVTYASHVTARDLTASSSLLSSALTKALAG
jgi:hypothetical protein